MPYEHFLALGTTLITLGLVLFFLQRALNIHKMFPWQISAFVHLLILFMFLYILQSLTVIHLTSPDKIAIFNSGINLTGDLLKTVVGAVIGSLAMTISRDKNLNGVPDDEENLTTSQEEPESQKV